MNDMMENNMVSNVFFFSSSFVKAYSIIKTYLNFLISADQALSTKPCITGQEYR